jgi:HI0933-like protein
VKFCFPHNPFSPSVAVLGAGAAGLMAAHAAVEEGARVSIFDINNRPKALPGAQFLHEAIPGLPCGDPLLLRIDGRGDASGYAQKVYGHPMAPSSFDQYVGRTIEGFRLHTAYLELFERYGWMISEVRVEASMLVDLLNAFDLVVSTIPRNVLCVNPDHTFQHATVVITGVAKQTENNVIVYNGDPEDAWYRTSTIDGRTHTEYPGRTSLLMSDERGIMVRKPTTTDCICWKNQDNLILTGRYGSWNKSKLAHHAFRDTLDALHAYHYSA